MSEGGAVPTVPSPLMIYHSSQTHQTEPISLLQ